MKILVTGGKGYVGSRLVERLKKLGHDVKSFSQEDGEDVRELEEVKKASKGIDAIYHLAALISISKSIKEPYEFFEVNAHGTANVLEAARINGIETVILCSTSKVYGKAQKLPIDENHPLIPASPYGASKLIAELLCRQYALHYGIKTPILRVFNVYGPEQKSDLIIPTILRQAEKGSEIALRSVQSKRDFVYVDDVIDALVLALEKRESDTYNIGTGEATSIEELVGIASKLMKKKLEIRLSGSDPLTEERADVEKAKKKLGFEAKVGIEEGLKRTISSLEKK
ncbi:MAG: GDP-mannose 4,6-dehydratase [Candidatus Micrarchaeota archaeon]